MTALTVVELLFETKSNKNRLLEEGHFAVSKPPPKGRHGMESSATIQFVHYILLPVPMWFQAIEWCDS